MLRDSKAPGGQRQQTWHIPSLTECIICHNMAAKYSLGAQTLQLNTDRDYGGGNAEFQLLATLELGDMGILGVRPAHGAFNLPNARLLAPHDPYRSIMFYRTSTLGPARMPRLGSNVVDEAGVRLLHDWIARLP